MWYAAHAVMLMRFDDGVQDEFPVWENIFLIEAKDGDEGTEKAEKRAREDETEPGNGATVNERPIHFSFVGLRKLMQCFSDEAQPSDGTEVSHNQLAFRSQADLDTYVAGEEVEVTFGDENPFDIEDD